MTLRPYQQEAVDAAILHMRQSTEPFLIEAATGAGKSHMIASIAYWVNQTTGKRVLCLAPSKELVLQNRSKYAATGNPSSLFSASAGRKSTSQLVVFGSPLTVKNSIRRFKRGDYAVIVIDEAHGITPTVRFIIDEMREANPNLRVCGLSATPYRLLDGYIFAEWPDGTMNGDDTAKIPYFGKLVYSIQAPELIEMGYLTPPLIGQIGSDAYDTSKLVPNRLGKFDSDAVDRAYHGQGRLTSSIVGDVVEKARDRKGVMFFAATVKHAEEIMQSLPPGLSAMVTGETDQKGRKEIIKAFLDQSIKYLVNVSVLTTGFDAPHVDCIAILRKTESAGLLQQIIGRGLRLDESKNDCLILDYTTNMEDHCPDGDIFSPIVTAKQAGGSKHGSVVAECPDCGYGNTFSRTKATLDYKCDKHGYCIDLDGVQIQTEYGPLSAHSGRRCNGFIRVSRKEFERCGYRWTSKDCPNCEEPNDIAARRCSSCKSELVDPNEKLRLDFKAQKRDPYRIQTDKVLEMSVTEGKSSKGNNTLRVTWTTPYRSFTTWFLPNASFAKAIADYEGFKDATDGQAPETVTYMKDRASGFYRVLGYNRDADIEPTQ